MLLAGTEAGEECWIRLFLTRSRYVDDALATGFPDDVCSNKLIVSAYKHDMLLRYSEMEEDDGGTMDEGRLMEVRGGSMCPPSRLRSTGGGR